jgi:diadenosine tetraphosphate (Ap4A) HIT family hydrolase
VFHLHLHVVPRQDGDHLARPWSATKAAPERLAATRAAMDLRRYP